MCHKQVVNPRLSVFQITVNVPSGPASIKAVQDPLSGVCRKDTMLSAAFTCLGTLGGVSSEEEGRCLDDASEEGNDTQRNRHRQLWLTSAKAFAQ